MSELSLYSPPVCRRFLAGGAEPLRLSWSAAAALAGGGAALALIGHVLRASGDFGPAVAQWPAIAASLVPALLLAGLTARWLGSRTGVLAGLLLIGSILLIPVPWGAIESLFCGAVIVAMGAFALGNASGRLPLIDRRATRWTFYVAAASCFVLAGPIGPAAVFATIPLFLVLSTDARMLGFLADPVGIGILLLVGICRWASPAGLHEAWAPVAALSGEALGPPIGPIEAVAALAVATLPWLPAVALAVVVGLHRGHYATPIWKLFASWLLGPLALLAWGPFRHGVYLGVLLPPLAAIGAVGLAGVFAACRRRWQGLRGG
ncbi:MAG: hypothetical protein JXB62_17810 [Pirellulales bacterium]|nr:hypothetical protein [Pirellulales bacterium]